MPHRRCFLFILGCMFSLSVVAQNLRSDSTANDSTRIPPPKEFSVGIDVFRNIPFLLLGNRAGLIMGGELHNRLIFEGTFRKKLNSDRSWIGLLGYASGEIYYKNEVQERNQFWGWYGKGGKEWAVFRGNHTKIGLLGIVTYARYRTDLRFKGPTFGDYTETREIVNAGLGGEPYFAYDFFLNSRWMLRWITRVSFQQRLTGEGYTPYYPGIGNVPANYNLIVSGGTTLQFHYRFRPGR
jgi:hypothetical protein